MVVKTALKTVLIVIIALILAFITASLGFPQHMATMFEKMGSYSFATGYAGLAYKYNGTVENLARCVDDSVFADDDANIVNYGDKLVAREDFIEYSENRTKADIERAEQDGIDMGDYSYYHFVYSNLARAKYNRGNSDGAFETAQKSMQDVPDFPVNNAFAVLAIRSVEKADKEFSERILNEIVKFKPAADQLNYYNAVIAILS